MARKLISILYILLLGFFASSVSGQGIDQNQRFVCIKPISCIDSQTRRANLDARCEGYARLNQLVKKYEDAPEGKTKAEVKEAGELGTKLGHSARITTDAETKPIPNTETYIIECFGKSKYLPNSVCTTGDPAVDRDPFGYTTALAQLKDKLQYKFEGLHVTDGNNVQQPRMTDGSGNFREKLEWQRTTNPNLGAVSSILRGVNFYSAAEAGVGNEGGQQQGTIDFETADKTCVKIKWDPTGRVFDANTLEPIKGAIVTLEQLLSDGTYSKLDLGGFTAFINPQITDSDGVFNFAVPNGSYRLVISKSGYVQTDAIEKINHNYSTIYSNIYPLETGERIIQRGQVELRDIPMSPVGRSQNNEPEIMEMFETLNKANGVLQINGRVSHPYANVRALNGATVLKSVRADKFGIFEMNIDQRMYKPTSAISYEVEKGPLTGLVSFIHKLFPSLIKDVAAATKSNFTTEPIPNYLEGYAYDLSGNILPNATAGVYVYGSTKPYYKVQTDDKGFFKMTSENLPDVPYTLGYTTSGGATTSLKPSIFLQQNEEYLNKSEVDLFVYKDTQGRTYEQSTNQNSKSNPSVDGQNPVVQESVGNNIIVTVLILVLLIVILAGVLGAYLYKKKHQAPIVQ